MNSFPLQSILFWIAVTLASVGPAVLKSEGKPLHSKRPKPPRRFSRQRRYGRPKRAHVSPCLIGGSCRPGDFGRKIILRFQ